MRLRVFLSFTLVCFWTCFLHAQEEKDARPGSERPRYRFQGPTEVDFGPLEDGKEKSHESLERQGWVYLCDSRISPKEVKASSLGLWRVRNQEDPQRNLWSVVEEGGEWIFRNSVGKDQHGTDLISLQNFWDFDLHVELRVPKDSNSGIYLRGRYEIQILSTPAGKDVKLAPSDLGGIYNIKEPKLNASKGPGVWQTMDASIRGFHILNVRLNGEVIHDDVEIPEKWRHGTGSELGGDINSPGPIFLQGDHGSVDFRNIRIRPSILPLRSVIRSGLDRSRFREELKAVAPEKSTEKAPGKATDKKEN